jgi:hypothetical protein
MECGRSARSLPSGLIWVLFCAAVLIAAAPLWRWWLFGFNPTLDELLRLSVCGITRSIAEH